VVKITKCREWFFAPAIFDSFHILISGLTMEQEPAGLQEWNVKVRSVNDDRLAARLWQCARMSLGTARLSASS
jgi:hypothetical protein